MDGVKHSEETRGGFFAEELQVMWPQRSSSIVLEVDIHNTMGSFPGKLILWSHQVSFERG